MIALIEKIILERNIGNAQDKRGLDFLKYSTPTSGKRLTDKVILFVFEKNESGPFLCVKTVRNYGAKNVIKHNFDNLTKVNNSVKGSVFGELFSQALYLHDDGENIFSIETVCPGERITLNVETLNIVVEAYIGFQEHVVRSAKAVKNLKEWTEEIVRSLELPDKDSQSLLDYARKFNLDNQVLPEIIQHGDLTADNILLSRDEVHFIDYDYVSETTLPGYDLFGLFRRFDRKNLLSLCMKYFPSYFERIGYNFSKDYKGLLFIYYLIDLKRKLDTNLTAQVIIKDFESNY